MNLHTTSIRILLLAIWFLRIASAQELLWSDEFNTAGSESPKSEFWSFDTGNGGWGNGELQTYTADPSNVVVKGGLLKITARRDDTVNPPKFTSARIKTQDKVSFKYGRLEARIKTPDVDAGLWPAFWTLGSNVANVGWPAAGEVDIMEIGQGLAIEEGLANRRVVGAAHWDYQGSYATYAKSYDHPTDLNSDFHTYRLEWTPESMTTYVDNNEIWQMNIGPEDCADCEELHQPHFILLNMAIGGGFTSGGSSSSGSSGCGGSSSAGSSSSSGGCSTRDPEDITAPLPAELLVDWVRLYDNGHTVITVPPTPQPTPQPTMVSTNANPQTLPPTKKPTRQPTAAPATQAPVARSTRQPESPRPTSRPTPGPTPRPTSPPTFQPLTLSPVARSNSLEDDDDFYYVGDDDDCFFASVSRSSGGKAGKGGKGGKSGSRSTTSRSGVFASGKSGKGSRRQLMGGKGGKGSSSTSRRSGCRAARGSSKGKGKGKSGGGEARLATHTSHLAAEGGMGSAAPSLGSAMQISLCLMLVTFAGIAHN